MTDPQQTMLAALRDLAQSTEVLTRSLDDHDLEKAHEAISVLLMQGLTYFGPESPAMQQFFPVWDAIKNHIDHRDVLRASEQVQVWDRQLHEVISIVEQG